MPARVAAVHPLRAIPGGRITIHGTGFPVDAPRVPEVRFGDIPARVVYASSVRLIAVVPNGLDGGGVPIRIAGISGETPLVEVGAPFATGLHQVDSPVFDREGNLYVTFSGTRGQQVPVSIFRVRPNGTRETFSTGIVNPTSMAMDPEGRLYVSSRFEGTVYRVNGQGKAEAFATDLGVACGLTFGPDGTLFVGDRSGTIFRVDRNGRPSTFASLPPSVAAFHLAYGPDRALYVTAPTMSPYDAVYRIDEKGEATTVFSRFGRPQGLAFDNQGSLHVVEALAGASGLYRLASDSEPTLVLSGPGLVGVAFHPSSGLVVASNDTAYRLAASVRPA